ncbi:MAG TPA: 3-hydroxyacyl-ACP dehydratase FabZ [Burkholderiales bacterium]|nr:3-hydroxyacyl-ACP dehydratase FabZ [Burkholderiales bacterium]
MTTINIEEIREYLPHRYPFLLVDRVLSYVPGQEIVAVKNVSINEPFFQGHFPSHPVMPGVLILEAMAQTAAVLSFKTHEQKVDDDSVYYLVGIDGARFKRPVTPGDRLILKARVERFVKGVWKYACRAEVDEELAAEATLMAIRRGKE